MAFVCIAKVFTNHNQYSVTPLDERDIARFVQSYVDKTSKEIFPNYFFLALSTDVDESTATEES